MNIGIIAHNSKKSLIEDFCIAYKGILMKHEVYATGTTGRRIEEVTNLHVHKFLPGSVGGDKQFTEMIERGDMDMVIFFYNPTMINPKEPDVYKIIRSEEHTSELQNYPYLRPVQYPDCNKYRNRGVSDFGTCKRRSGLERAVESRLIHQTKTVRTKIRPT